MKEKKPDIIYSDPVKEIMGNPPGRILRWGTTVLFAVLILFILFAWFLRYPDTIPATIEITTRNPPVMLVSKITGRITDLKVKDNEAVSPDMVLAVMETTASIREVERLKQLIDTVKNPGFMLSESLPELSELGELQEYYGTFLKNLTDYNNIVFNDFYGNKIKSINAEINEVEEYIKRIKVKERLYSENKILETNKFKRDSSLFAAKFLSESDLEKSHQDLIRLSIELQQVRLEYSAKSIELAEKRQLLQDYRIMGLENREKYNSVLNESFLNLKAQINIWENTYLLISPIGGIVTFTKYWSINQTVVKDEPVLNIVPFEPGDIVGRINLKMQRSGKVEIGKIVNIKLSGYPYLEYGIVRGVVKSKSLVPTGDGYVLEINLPEGLKTLYGRKLEFTQNMQGIAEIITDDMSLLQKIINPFRYLISKNKR